MFAPDRPTWPRLIFGQGPDNFLDALSRLPPDTHPALSEDQVEGADESMIHLYNLRVTLEETVAAYAEGRLVRLEERMVPLTPEEVRVLEHWSFRKDVCDLAVVWSTLPRGSLWEQVFGEGGYHYHWQLGLMKPGINPPLRLVWVGTSDDFGRKDPTNYDIGIVTAGEWGKLTRELRETRYPE